MAIRYNAIQGSCQSTSCTDKFGCPSNRCPDFQIKRFDTKPALKILVEDCDGPLDLQGLVVEVNMWAVAKLKVAITEESEYIQLADNIGFEQVMQGDIIVMDRVRMPEYLLVTGFDESNKLIRVQRGYRSTTPSAWVKGNKLRIFRIMDATALTEMVFLDVTNVDGTTETDVLSESYLVYEWSAEDVCLPGCYWLEFKLMKMIDVAYFLPGGNWVGEVHTHTDDRFYTGSTHTDSSVLLSLDQVNNIYLISNSHWTGETHVYEDVVMTGSDHDDGSVILGKTGVGSDSTAEYDDETLTIQAISNISFTSESLIPEDFGCALAEGVEWVRRFPSSDDEGFLIKIINSHTME